MFKENRIAYLDGGTRENSGSLEAKIEDDNLSYHYAIGILKISGIEGEDAEAILNDDTNPFSVYLLNARGVIGRGSKNDVDKGEKLKVFMASKEYTRALNWQGLLLPGLKNALGKIGINYEMVKDRVSALVHKKDVSTLILLNNIERGGRLDADTLNNFANKLKTKEDVKSEARNKLNGLSHQIEMEKLDVRSTDRDAETVNDKFDVLEEQRRIKEEKYGDILSKKHNLIEEVEGAGTLSDEDYATVTEGLDDLIDEAVERMSPEAQDLNGQLAEFMSSVEDMATDGASAEEIIQLLKSADLANKSQKSKDSEYDPDMAMIEDLYDTKLSTIFNHYQVNKVGNGDLVKEKNAE